MDIISDAIIGSEIISDIEPSIIGFLNAAEAFFGFDGMQAIYDVIHGLGNVSIANIYPMLIFDGGQISGISGIIEGLTSEETVNALKGIKTISEIMIQKGVNLASQQGQVILTATLEKIKEYGPGLTSAAIGTYIGNQVVNYASKKGDQIVDKVTDKISNVLPNLGINNN